MANPSDDQKPSSDSEKPAYEYAKESAETKRKGHGPAFIEIIRPLNCIMAAIAVYIAALIAGVVSIVSPVFLAVLMATLVVFLVSAGGMVANDIFDVEIDKINKPKRPLPSGRMSIKAAKAYAAALFIIGIVVSYFINIYAFGVAVLASLLLVAYAAKLKKVMFAGNVVTSLLVGLTFVYGGLINFSLENVQPLITILPFAILAFLSNMGRELYKTIEDALGDKKAGAETFTVKYGVFKARAAASTFIILAVLLSFIPFALGTFGINYVFVVIIADIIFIAAALSPLKYSSKLTKLAMLIALVAFLVGALFR